MLIAAVMSQTIIHCNIEYNAYKVSFKYEQKLKSMAVHYRRIKCQLHTITTEHYTLHNY